MPSDRPWSWGPPVLTLPPIGIAAAALLTLLVYLPAAHAPLIFDDTTAIDNNPTIVALSPLSVPLHPPADTPVAGRPIANVSLALNYAVNQALRVDQSRDPGGPNKTFSYHIFNIMLHVSTGLLLFGIVRRTLRGGRFGDRWVLDAGPFALFVAAIWLLHPIQTEAVNYLSQRTELLVSFCFVATLYASIRAWESRTRNARAAWYVAAVVACFLGMGSKEVMVAAPLLIVLYDRVFQLTSWRDLLAPAMRGRCWFYVALFATLLFLGVLLASHPRSASAGFDSGMTPISYLLTQGWAIPHYLQLVFWPAHLTIDYGQEPLALASGLPGLIALAAMGIATIAAWRRPNRWGWLGFCGAWFFCILAPSSSVIPVTTEVAAERRIYLALAAVIIVVVVSADRLVRRLLPAPARAPSRRTLGVVMTVIVGALAVRTYARSNDYRSPEMIWRNAIADRPMNARAWNNLGSVLADLPQPRAVEADSFYRHAVAIDSSYVPALYNLALSAIARRQYAEAEQLLRRVATIAPDDEPALMHLGGVMLMRSDAAGALPYLQRAIDLAPDDTDARTVLGVAKAMLLRDTAAKRP